MPLRAPNIVLNLAHYYNPISNHMQTATTVAATLSPLVNAMALMMQNSGTNDARYIIGGTVNPTATKGFALPANAEPIVIPISQDSNIVVIDEQSGAVIEYQWLGISR